MMSLFCVFFFKQNTAYDMLISDWSSDVCSSDLEIAFQLAPFGNGAVCPGWPQQHFAAVEIHLYVGNADAGAASDAPRHLPVERFGALRRGGAKNRLCRSEEHTSELQSLMRISYAVFCLKKKNQHYHKHTITHYPTAGD